jgi:hypothetical protein
MKSLGDEMEIVNAYELVGTYRGAAALCGPQPRRSSACLSGGRSAKLVVGRHHHGCATRQASRS